MVKEDCSAWAEWISPRRHQLFLRYKFFSIASTKDGSFRSENVTYSIALCKTSETFTC